MLQNLRYIPSGVTPENDMTAVNNGIWFPVLMNDQGTGVAFSTDYVFSVVHYGYTYNFSTAMGKEPDYAYKLLKEVLAGTKTQAEVLAELKTLEGKQGICPEGRSPAALRCVRNKLGLNKKTTMTANGQMELTLAPVSAHTNQHISDIVGKFVKTVNILRKSGMTVADIAEQTGKTKEQVQNAINLSDSLRSK